MYWFNEHASAIQAVAAIVTVGVTGVLVWINKRTIDRSDAAIAAANETTRVIARSEWGARLIFLGEPEVQGTEAEKNQRITWRVQNIGPAPARIALVRFKLPTVESESRQYLQGTGEGYLTERRSHDPHSPRRPDIATLALPCPPRSLTLEGTIPGGTWLRVTYTDDLGQQELVWPQDVELPPWPE